MKDYCVLIPVYTNKENAYIVDRCIEMLDIDPKRVLLVDNTPDNYCKKFEDQGFNISYHPENLGVSRSWNLGLKLGHDWTIMVSCSMRFPEGFSAIVEVLEKFQGEYVMLTPQGWHCSAISQKVVEAIGYMDENFYHGYMEDTDFAYRMALAELPHGGFQDVPAYSQKTALAVNSGVTTNPPRSTAYWEKKWGGSQDNPQFELPFGDQPLNYWPEKTIEELTKEWDDENPNN